MFYMSSALRALVADLGPPPRLLRVTDRCPADAPYQAMQRYWSRITNGTKMRKGGSATPPGQNPPANV